MVLRFQQANALPDTKLKVSRQRRSEQKIDLVIEDGAGNTVEENSSVFSLIRMR